MIPHTYQEGHRNFPVHSRRPWGHVVCVLCPYPLREIRVLQLVKDDDDQVVIRCDNVFTDVDLKRIEKHGKYKFFLISL